MYSNAMNLLPAAVVNERDGWMKSILTQTENVRLDSINIRIQECISRMRICCLEALALRSSRVDGKICW